jgi:hypothetical protein
MNPRVLLTVFLLSMILAYITSSREKQGDASGLSNGYISWNEFVQDMLSKGEVRLIILSHLFYKIKLRLKKLFFI